MYCAVNARGTAPTSTHIAEGSLTIQLICSYHELPRKSDRANWGSWRLSQGLFHQILYLTFNDQKGS